MSTRGWHLQSTVTPSMSPVSPTNTLRSAEDRTVGFVLRLQERSCWICVLCMFWRIALLEMASFKQVFMLDWSGFCLLKKKKKKEQMGSMREGKNFFQMSSDVQTFCWSAVSAAREEDTVSAYSLLPHINTITGLHERIITTSEDYTPFFSCRWPRRPVCHLRLPPCLLFLLLCLSLPWVT